MQKGSKKGTKTGKRFSKSLACLFLLIVMLGCMVLPAAKAFPGTEKYENLIDAKYLPLLESADEENKIILLEEYEKAWKEQLEEYLADYRSKCADQSEREMADEYLDAVYYAVDAQKCLMDYMNMPDETQLWYSSRIYYYALLKDLCIECGEDETESSREAFNVEWSNRLALLTMTFYEELDEEGKLLAGQWQESREQWKAASFGKEGTKEEQMEVNGWINQLYYQQLESIMNEGKIQISRTWK